MPLFTVECAACGQKGEALVRSGEAPACPACGAGAVTKGLSRFAAVAGGSAADAACNLGPMCCGGGCGVPAN